jgi:mono/diheme cytochrome c family protein
MRGKRLFLTGVALLLFGLGGMAVMHGFTMGSGRGGFYGKSAYRTNGERIYYLALNRAGSRVSFRGGPQWLSMMGGSCVNCHGVNGRGGIPIMMSTAVAPNITYQALVSGEHGGHRDGKTGAGTYDDELIKRAVTDGLAAAGRPLDWTMPRWLLNEEDLEDLIEYLKVLGEPQKD